MLRLRQEPFSFPSGRSLGRYSRVSAAASFKDLVIAMLADGEEALRARIADLEDERERYRELAQEALTQLAELTRRCKQYQDTYYRLLAEWRRDRREREDR